VARVPESPRQRAAASLARNSGTLSTAATAQMEAEMPWFRELSAEDRSWVALIVQAGIRSFLEWFQAGGSGPLQGSEVASSVFGAAPRALAGEEQEVAGAAGVRVGAHRLGGPLARNCVAH